jgi:hypothetical protein
MPMTKYRTKEFWEAAADRAIRSLAQGALAAIPTGAIFLHEFNWLLVLSSAAFMATLSFLTSLASPPVEVQLSNDLARYKAKAKIETEE